jgi:hypothetical protein
MNTIDLTKTPLENMLTLINNCSSVQFDAEDLTFSAPEPYTSLTDTALNTSVIVTATSLSPVSGIKTPKYRRLHLLSDFSDAQMTFSFPVGTTSTEILNFIIANRNWHTGSALTGEFTLVDKFKITAPDTDYLYIGSVTVTIIFTVTP